MSTIYAPKLAQSLEMMGKWGGYRPDAITRLHNIKCLVDLAKRLPVSDEFIDLESAVHIILNKSG